MIRVHTAADEGTRDFFFAKSEIRESNGTWHDFGDSRLQIEILNSGYQWPCDEHGVPATPYCSTCGRSWTPAHAKGEHA